MRRLTFASFKHSGVQDGLELLASADQLAVFLGAGVSAEAGLPRWPELVNQLLLAASAKVFANKNERQRWVARIMLTELPPGAAGIAETLLEKDLVATLARELYRRPEDGVLAAPANFKPGPTCHAVAALRRACDKATRFHHPMKILTTNYDMLLEKALVARSDVHTSEVCPITSWPVDNDSLPSDRIKVHHLHGYFSGRRKIGEITLADTSYYATNPSAQRRDKAVLEILSNARCLFLGTSFTDPNITRYIFASAEERRQSQAQTTPRHVALFSHHSADPPRIQKARQEIVERRLTGTYTKAVFVDHYADVSQFVYDLKGKIDEGTAYIRQDVRAKRVLKPILDRMIAPTRPDQFDKAQPALSGRLKDILDEVTLRVEKRAKATRSGEPLAMALWLLNIAGTKLTPWVTTDRSHRDPRLLFAIDVEPGSRWIAVRAVCEGKVLIDTQEHDDSRWTYVAGAPLLVDDGHSGRTCIGALTVTSVTPPRRSWIHNLSENHKRLMSSELTDEVSAWLTSVYSP